jgi:hypothetical protein
MHIAQQAVLHAAVWRQSTTRLQRSCLQEIFKIMDSFRYLILICGRAHCYGPGFTHITHTGRLVARVHCSE